MRKAIAAYCRLFYGQMRDRTVPWWRRPLRAHRMATWAVVVVRGGPYRWPRWVGKSAVLAAGLLCVLVMNACSAGCEGLTISGKEPVNRMTAEECIELMGRWRVAQETVPRIWARDEPRYVVDEVPETIAGKPWR